MWGWQVTDGHLDQMVSVWLACWRFTIESSLCLLVPCVRPSSEIVVSGSLFPLARRPAQIPTRVLGPAPHGKEAFLLPPATIQAMRV